MPCSLFNQRDCSGSPIFYTCRDHARIVVPYLTHAPLKNIQNSGCFTLVGWWHLADDCWLITIGFADRRRSANHVQPPPEIKNPLKPCSQRSVRDMIPGWDPQPIPLLSHKVSWCWAVLLALLAALIHYAACRVTSNCTHSIRYSFDWLPSSSIVKNQNSFWSWLGFAFFRFFGVFWLFAPWRKGAHCKAALPQFPHVRWLPPMIVGVQWLHCNHQQFSNSHIYVVAQVHYDLRVSSTQAYTYRCAYIHVHFYKCAYAYAYVNVHARSSCVCMPIRAYACMYAYNT